ncbi:hypothetical protein CYLTODRAFT_420616 [Cylindrobasidium torrendii FP15055 ss-10]|uniref:Uncharacterized protein n=1 Tax=Cylindrobasidium torrendii FP15055 ss-10 TaxID=1314674 RepID=A0A0D7BIS9_9AGAR|nr:hypothetical protein CYLTODRAFT_420616 [Cylindrobasidium torrendii FP15055 ss-10]
MPLPILRTALHRDNSRDKKLQPVKEHEMYKLKAGADSQLTFVSFKTAVMGLKGKKRTDQAHGLNPQVQSSSSVDGLNHKKLRAVTSDESFCCAEYLKASPEPLRPVPPKPFIAFQALVIPEPPKPKPLVPKTIPVSKSVPIFPSQPLATPLASSNADNIAISEDEPTLPSQPAAPLVLSKEDIPKSEPTLPSEPAAPLASSKADNLVIPESEPTLPSQPAAPLASSKADKFVISKKLPRSNTVLENTALLSSKELAATKKLARARIRDDRRRREKEAEVPRPPTRPSRPTETTQLPYTPVEPLPAVRKHAVRSNSLPYENEDPDATLRPRMPVRPHTSSGRL